RSRGRAAGGLWGNGIWKCDCRGCIRGVRVEARSTGSRYSGADHGARQPMAALSSGVCDPFLLQVLLGLSGGFMDLSRIGSDRAIDYHSSRAEPAGPRAEIAVAVMGCI